MHAGPGGQRSVSRRQNQHQPHDVTAKREPHKDDLVYRNHRRVWGVGGGVPADEASGSRSRDAK